MSDASPQCPRCHSALVEESHADRTFHSCASCDGCFAPLDTISHFREDARRLHRELPEEPAPKPKDYAGPPRAVAHCPQCDQPMSSRLCYFGSDVTVDTCREHGVWFDATELSRTIAALDVPPTAEDRASASSTPGSDAQGKRAGFVYRLLERAFGGPSA